ncbi:MAG: hypothetical protein ACT4OE_01720 [Sphingosinicella sp.]
MKRGLIAAAAMMAVAGCQPAGNQQAAENAAGANAAQTNNADPIASATSAAPPSVSRDAAVVAMDADGSMRTLREGRNGFTCMPDNPATPGPDPMCMDANAMRWAMAWIGRTPPPADTVGLMYMLRGGTDASNVDPHAQTPTAGNAWIETGPHLMVVGSESLLRNYQGGASPDTSGPYIMWAGTPYAHLMIPVG